MRNPVFKHRFMFKVDASAEFRQIGDLYSYEEKVPIAHTVFFDNTWVKVSPRSPLSYTHHAPCVPFLGF